MNELYLHAEINDEGQLVFVDNHGRRLCGVVGATLEIAANDISRAHISLNLFDKDNDLMVRGKVK